MSSTSSKPQQVQLIGTRRNVERVQVAPGIEIARRLVDHAPHYGLIRLRRDPEGTLTPMLSTWKAGVRLTADLGERLGIGLSHRHFTILIRAGFIRAKRPAPRTTIIDLESLHQHLLACEDPDFWNEENLNRWKLAEDET